MLNSHVQQLTDDYLRMQDRYGESHPVTLVAKHSFDIVQDALGECVADAATFFCSDCEKSENCVGKNCQRKQNFIMNLISDNIHEI